MIAVSSHKPNSPIQHSAKRTWDRVFDFVVYFGAPEKPLAGPRTAFVPAEPFPRIKTVVAFCAAQPGWSAIVNADIHLADSLPLLENHLLERHKSAAISGRYQFTPPAAECPTHGTIEDMGLDFFAAEQVVWRQVEAEIPDLFRFGHILWDTWLQGFLLTHCGTGLADLTRWQVVFHPRHERAPATYPIDSAFKDKYILAARWPIPSHAL